MKWQVKGEGGRNRGELVWRGRERGNEKDITSSMWGKEYRWMWIRWGEDEAQTQIWKSILTFVAVHRKYFVRIIWLQVFVWNASIHGIQEVLVKIHDAAFLNSCTHIFGLVIFLSYFITISLCFHFFTSARLLNVSISTDLTPTLFPEPGSKRRK